MYSQQQQQHQHQTMNQRMAQQQAMMNQNQLLQQEMLQAEMMGMGGNPMMNQNQFLQQEILQQEMMGGNPMMMNQNQFLQAGMIGGMGGMGGYRNPMATVAANQMGNVAQMDRYTGNTMGAVRADLTASQIDTINGDYMAASSDREAAQLSAMGMGKLASGVEFIAEIERDFGF